MASKVPKLSVSGRSRENAKSINHRRRDLRLRKVERWSAINLLADDKGIRVWTVVRRPKVDKTAQKLALAAVPSISRFSFSLRNYAFENHSLRRSDDCTNLLLMLTKLCIRFAAVSNKSDLQGICVNRIWSACLRKVLKMLEKVIRFKRQFELFRWNSSMKICNRWSEAAVPKLQLLFRTKPRLLHNFSCRCFRVEWNTLQLFAWLYQICFIDLLSELFYSLPFDSPGMLDSVGVEFIFHNCVRRGAGYGCTGPSCHGCIAGVGNCGWLGPVVSVQSTGETQRWPWELEVVSGCGCLQHGIRFHRQYSGLEWVAHLVRCTNSLPGLLVLGFGYRGSSSIPFLRPWSHCRWSNCTGSCRHGKCRSCRTLSGWRSCWLGKSFAAAAGTHFAEVWTAVCGGFDVDSCGRRKLAIGCFGIAACWSYCSWELNVFDELWIF